MQRDQAIAHVTAGDIVYDLGSADGRIPIAAAKQYGAQSLFLLPRLNQELISKLRLERRRRPR